MRSSRWNRLSFVYIHAAFRIYTGPGRKIQRTPRGTWRSSPPWPILRAGGVTACLGPRRYSGQWLARGARWLSFPLAGSYLFLLPFQFPHADVSGLRPRGPLRCQPGLRLRRESIHTLVSHAWKLEDSPSPRKPHHNVHSTRNNGVKSTLGRQMMTTSVCKWETCEHISFVSIFFLIAWSKYASLVRFLSLLHINLPL